MVGGINQTIPGTVTVYGITVRNLGTVSLPATIQFAMPSETDYVQSIPPGVYTSGTHNLMWNLGVIDPGTTTWFRVWASIRPLGVGRDASYQAAKKRVIPFMWVGRCMRVPIAAMERLMENPPEAWQK